MKIFTSINLIYLSFSLELFWTINYHFDLNDFEQIIIFNLIILNQS